MKPNNPKLTRCLAAIVGAPSDAAAWRALSALHVDPGMAFAEARRRGLVAPTSRDLTADGIAWARAELATLAPLAAAVTAADAFAARLEDAAAVRRSSIRTQSERADAMLRKIGFNLRFQEIGVEVPW